MRRLYTVILGFVLGTQVFATDTFFWRCESTTLNGTDDFSAGDTTATAVSLVELTAGAARYGSLGINTPGSADWYEFDSASIVSTTQGAVAFRCRITALGGDSTIFAVYNSGAPADQISLTTLDTGTNLRLRHRVNGGDNNTLDTTALNLTTSTWYTFVIRWNTNTNTLRLEVYDDSGTLIQGVENTPTVDPQSALTTFQFGSGDNSARYNLDNLVISNDSTDPVQTWASYTSYTQIAGSSTGLLLRRRRT